MPAAATFVPFYLDMVGLSHVGKFGDVIMGEGPNRQTFHIGGFGCCPVSSYAAQMQEIRVRRAVVLVAEYMQAYYHVIIEGMLRCGPIFCVTLECVALCCVGVYSVLQRVRCGVVWHCAVQYDMVRCDVAWCNLASCCVVF